MQDENQRLEVKCSKLEERVITAETEVNSLNQDERRSNIVFTRIPEFAQDYQLESTVTSILFDIDVPVNIYDIENCFRFDKPGSKSKWKKNNCAAN